MWKPFKTSDPNLRENVREEARLLAHQEAKLHGEDYKAVFEQVFKTERQRLLEEAEE
jgi:hypothetical protein